VEERYDRCPAEARGVAAGGGRWLVAGRRLPGPVRRAGGSSSSRAVGNDAGHRHVAADTRRLLVLCVNFSVSSGISS